MVRGRRSAPATGGCGGEAAMEMGVCLGSRKSAVRMGRGGWGAPDAICLGVMIVLLIVMARRRRAQAAPAFPTRKKVAGEMCRPAAMAWSVPMPTLAGGHRSGSARARVRRGSAMDSPEAAPCGACTAALLLATS